MSMPDIDKQIRALEMRLTRKPEIKTAVALTLRCWLAYDVGYVSDPRAYLHKANYTILSLLRKNESDIRLQALAVFISIEAERFDTANEMLDSALGFRNFLKSNEPFYYAAFNFLYAYLEIKQKRARSAKKHMRTLQDFVKTAGNDSAYPLMLGMLHLAFYEYDEAAEYLSKSYESGNNSVFLYRSLYQYFKTALNVVGGRMLLPAVRWAVAKQADTDDIMNVCQQELHTAIMRDPAAGERIYAYSSNPAVLRALCECRMLAKDYGPEAYAYYKDAERRQLPISGLYQYVVRAAYVNQSERINHYAMVEFLRGADMDDGLKIYVYHLLLTDPAHTDLLPERKNEILQFCTYCLENNVTGRRVNSLYYYFWAQCKEMRITGPNVEKAEALLFADLCRFEISAPPSVKFIYVIEREKKGMAVYECTPRPDGGVETVITAADEQLSLTCLGAGRKNIVDVPVTVRRMIPRAEPSLYRYFFKKGEHGFALLAYLANYFLARLSEDADLTSGAAEAIPVFEAVLADKDVAKSYKMRILVALGGLYYRTGQFDKALNYYGGVDENDLDDAYIEQILNVYLQTHEWARVAGLIMRKGRFISDKALFNALKLLSGKEHAAHHANLADAAYELLVGSWFDHALLSIVLTHYNGGQAEWQALSRALTAINITEPRLDEIILKNSIWMHQLDEDAQKTFVRMFNNGVDFNHPLLKRFSEYCAYEMLINDVRPDYETLTLLEKAYLRGAGDELLVFALSHVYLRYNLTTFHSERIYDEALRVQESLGILFPVFREQRDKRPSRAYIEKNQPFLYRSLPNKNVWLYYRIDDETTFHAQRMRYLRFGLYLTNLALFYHEKLTYYFSEELPTGSITTREKTIHNDVVYLDEQQEDPFFVINNAMIYEQMFRYDQVEKIITGLVKEVKRVRSGLM